MDAILKFFREAPILTGAMFAAIYTIIFGLEAAFYVVIAEIFTFLYFLVITSDKGDDDDWFDPRGPRIA